MSQTPELPDDGALEAVQFCLSIIRNNRTKPEDNAIWSCGTSSKPRITQKVLEACEAALAQSTQSPVEQPPQTVAGDEAREIIKALAVNIQVLLNVIDDPDGGSALAKMIIVETAKNTKKNADEFITRHEGV